MMPPEVKSLITYFILDIILFLISSPLPTCVVAPYISIDFDCSGAGVCWANIRFKNSMLKKINFFILMYFNSFTINF